MGQTHQIREEDMVLLTALLDGALNPREAAAVQQRLAHEDALHEAYLDLVLIRNELAQLPDVRVPRSFRLDDATFQRARGWRWWFHFPPGGLVTPALGAVTSLVAVIFFVQGLLSISPLPAEQMTFMATSMEAPLPADELPLSDAQRRASAPMMAESAPQSDESAPLVAESAPQSDASAPMMAESAPQSDDTTAKIANESIDAATEDVPTAFIDMGYQPYGDVWFNWTIAGIILSAVVLASSIRWLIHVWLRQRHTRS